MTVTATKERPPTASLNDDSLRHYTPEELVDPDGQIRLPTTARMLREWAYERRIPHNRLGRRVTFTATDVREISAQFAVRPFDKGKPQARAV
ncbi:hypothetical protein U9R90_25140 [Streptomyces sp. E11-3]|uniref:hypothetical protein n=1 Tax=Streptomyces sp. E11-3 TaxID=3110112 RepID=UPI00398175E6